jgi:hypothetical protein
MTPMPHWTVERRQPDRADDAFVALIFILIVAPQWSKHWF